MAQQKYNALTGQFDLVDEVPATAVTAAAVLADNAVLRGDGGVRGLQDSGVLIDDTDNITAVASITLAAGATIDEFSIDGTLAGNSDTALPTEKAVKTYVDGATPVNNVTAASVISDNALCRGNGGARDIQESSILIDDTDNITAVASITLNAGATIDEFSIDGTLAGDSDTAIPTEKAVKTYVDALPAAEMPDYVREWHAGQLEAQETAFAPLEKITTTSIIQNVRAFDYNTIEYCNGTFEVPPDIDTSGTVTFSLWWFARLVPSPSENVIWQFEHSAVDSTDDLDSATYTAEVAAASATGTTQNALVRCTWTETVSNLAWTAGQIVYFRVSRKATDANDTFDSQADTNDDALMRNFAVIIPQA